MHQAIFAKRYWYLKAQNKHALSPIGRRLYFDISAPHVHNPVTTIMETSEDDTQAYLNNSQHRSFVWKNAKSTLLTNKKKTMQPRHPIRALLAPRVISTAGKLLWYLHVSYLLPDRNNPSFECLVPPIFSSFLSSSSLYLYSICKDPSCTLKSSALSL